MPPAERVLPGFAPPVFTPPAVPVPQTVLQAGIDPVGYIESLRDTVLQGNVLQAPWLGQGATLDQYNWNDWYPEIPLFENFTQYANALGMPPNIALTIMRDLVSYGQQFEAPWLGTILTSSNWNHYYPEFPRQEASPPNLIDMARNAGVSTGLYVLFLGKFVQLGHDLIAPWLGDNVILTPENWHQWYPEVPLE